jgi:transposase
MSFKYKIKESYSLEELQSIIEQKEQFDLKSYVPKTQYEEVSSKLNQFEELQKENELKEQFVKNNGDITLFNKFKKLYEGEDIEEFKKENNFLFKEFVPSPIEKEETTEPIAEPKEKV